MPDTQVPAAEPSAAADSYLGDSFKQFDARVNPPAKTETKPENDAEPGAAATSEKTKPEEKSKTAAEPGAAKPQEKDKKNEPLPKDKPSADERIGRLTAEYNAEIKRLEGEIAKLKPEAKPETVKEAPKRPNPFNWTGTQEEYDKAMDVYEAYVRQQATVDAQNLLRQQATQQELAVKLNDARARYQDADTRIFPTIKAIAEAPIANAVKAMINDSEVMVDLVYTLGGDGKLDQFLETAKTNPGKALREIFVIEGLVREELAKAAKKPGAKPEPKADEKDKKTAPVKPEPRAPEPPDDLGGKATTPNDELDSAVRDGDYTRAKRVMESRYFRAS